MKKRSIILAALMLLILHTPAAASEPAVTPEPVCLPVLMYHRLLKHSPGDIYTITPDGLEEDLAYLKKQGYTAVGVRELIDFVNDGVPLPDKPVMLTFDDGHYNNLYYGVPLLEKYGMKAVIFIVGKYSENSSAENDVNPNYSYITWEQMEQAPPQIEYHSHTWDMHNLSPRKGIGRKHGESRADYELALASDLLKLQDKIRRHTGSAPAAFAHPYGVSCQDAVPVMRAAGIEVSFCSRQGVNYLTQGDPDSLYGLKRLLRTPCKSAQRLLE